MFVSELVGPLALPMHGQSEEGSAGDFCCHPHVNCCPPRGKQPRAQVPVPERSSLSPKANFASAHTKADLSPPWQGSPWVDLALCAAGPWSRRWGGWDLNAGIVCSHPRLGGALGRVRVV